MAMLVHLAHDNSAGANAIEASAVGAPSAEASTAEATAAGDSAAGASAVGDLAAHRSAWKTAQTQSREKDDARECSGGGDAAIATRQLSTAVHSETEGGDEAAVNSKGSTCGNDSGSEGRAFESGPRHSGVGFLASHHAKLPVGPSDDDFLPKPPRIRTPRGQHQQPASDGVAGGNSTSRSGTGGGGSSSRGSCNPTDDVIASGCSRSETDAVNVLLLDKRSVASPLRQSGSPSAASLKHRHTKTSHGAGSDAWEHQQQHQQHQQQQQQLQQLKQLHAKTEEQPSVSKLHGHPRPPDARPNANDGAQNVTHLAQHNWRPTHRNHYSSLPEQQQQQQQHLSHPHHRGHHHYHEPHSHPHANSHSHSHLHHPMHSSVGPMRSVGGGSGRHGSAGGRRGVPLLCLLPTLLLLVPLFSFVVLPLLRRHSVILSSTNVFSSLAVLAQLCSRFPIPKIFGDGAPGGFGVNGNKHSFVRILDLPPRFNSDVLRQEPFAPIYAPSESTEVHVHRVLAASPTSEVWVGRGASKAALTKQAAACRRQRCVFFLPVYVALYRRLRVRAGVEASAADAMTAAFVADALAHAQSRLGLPHWTLKDSHGGGGNKPDIFIATAFDDAVLQCLMLPKLPPHLRRRVFFVSTGNAATAQVECGEGALKNRWSSTAHSPRVVALRIPPRVSAVVSLQRPDYNANANGPRDRRRPIQLLLPILPSRADRFSPYEDGEASTAAKEARARQRAMGDAVRKAAEGLRATGFIAVAEGAAAETAMASSVLCGCFDWPTSFLSPATLILTALLGDGGGSATSSMSNATSTSSTGTNSSSGSGGSGGSGSHMDVVACVTAALVSGCVPLVSDAALSSGGLPWSEAEKGDGTTRKSKNELGDRIPYSGVALSLKAILADPVLLASVVAAEDPLPHVLQRLLDTSQDVNRIVPLHERISQVQHVLSYDDGGRLDAANAGHMLVCALEEYMGSWPGCPTTSATLQQDVQRYLSRQRRAVVVLSSAVSSSPALRTPGAWSMQLPFLHGMAPLDALRIMPAAAATGVRPRGKRWVGRGGIKAMQIVPGTMTMSSTTTMMMGMPNLLKPGNPKLRMCTSRTSPFVAGSVLWNGSVYRTTVLEAELIRGAPAGRYPPRVRRGLQWGEEREAYVQIMVMPETMRTINFTRMHWAHSIPPNIEGMKLRCQFWHGVTGFERTRQPRGPVFESKAAVIRLYDDRVHLGMQLTTMILLHCPLPTVSKDTIGLLTAPAFQVKLVAADARSSRAWMPSVPLCREGVGHSAPFRSYKDFLSTVTGDLTVTVGPTKEGSRLRVVDEAEGNSGVLAGSGSAAAEAGASLLLNEAGELLQESAVREVGKLLQQKNGPAEAGPTSSSVSGSTGLLQPAASSQRHRFGAAARRLPQSRGSGGVAVCLRPMFTHGFFANRIHDNRQQLWDRLREYVDYHLMIGVGRLYFYDRYGEELMGFVKRYIQTGALLHVPFPFFSEVYYRQFLGHDAFDAQNFPDTYDQLYAMHHCLMLGRHNDDKWLVFADIDEYLQVRGAEGGRTVPAMLKQFEALTHTGEKPLTAVHVHRYQFTGDTPNTRFVMGDMTKRCPSTMAFKWRGGRDGTDHDKLILHPWRMLGATSVNHWTTFIPRGALGVLPAENAVMHHYGGGSRYPCKHKEDEHVSDSMDHPDTTLVWASAQLQRCWEELANISRPADMRARQDGLGKNKPVLPVGEARWDDDAKTVSRITDLERRGEFASNMQQCTKRCIPVCAAHNYAT